MVFLIRKQITYVKFIFCCINLIGDIFVLPRLLHVIESINFTWLINLIKLPKESIHSWPIKVGTF